MSEKCCRSGECQEGAAKQARIVSRSCIGCRIQRADSELVRVAVVEGEPLIGQRGSGRGAWLCPDPACVEVAARSRAFSRAFRSKLSDRYFADTLLGWLGNPTH